MSDKSIVKQLNYFWIIRCAGSHIKNNVECKIIPLSPTSNIMPILEVIDENIFTSFDFRVRSKYGRVFLEVPSYLRESSNKYQKKIDVLLQHYPDCSDFFLRYKSRIDVPVVSSEYTGLINYSRELDSLKRIRNEFEHIAVRTRIPNFDLRQTPTIEAKYRDIINLLSPNDYLFLDIFDLSGVLAQVKLNLERLIQIETV